MNICSNDGQRLYDAFAIGPLLIGGPVILMYGIIYTAFLIGPWALVGSATYLSFYPFMVNTYIIYLDQRDNSTNVIIFLANESILNAVGLK